MRVQNISSYSNYQQKPSFQKAYRWTKDLDSVAKDFMAKDGCGFWNGKIGQLLPNEFKAEINKFLKEKDIPDICFSKKTTKELLDMKNDQNVLQPKVRTLISDAQEISEKGKTKLKSLPSDDSDYYEPRPLGFKISKNNTDSFGQNP